MVLEDTYGYKQEFFLCVFYKRGVLFMCPGSLWEHPASVHLSRAVASSQLCSSTERKELSTVYFFKLDNG